MSEAAIAYYLDQFARQRSPASDWLTGIRTAAIDQFRLTGFPSTRQEDWKYTDIRPIIKRNFMTAGAAADDVRPQLLEDFSMRGLNCHELVFVNGSCRPACAQVRDLEQGVILQSLAEVLRHDAAGVRPYFEQARAPRQNAFDSLNSAFLAEGAYLYVPDGVTVEKPIHLLFIGEQQPEPMAGHFRNLIVLGKQASAVVIETYTGNDGAEYFTNTITEYTGAAGARLQHYKLQQESLRGFHVGSLRARLDRDSRLESHSLSLGGALVRNNIHVELAASGAAAILNGLYMAGGKQHIDNHTCVEHRVPQTASAGYYRGVLDGNARGVFNGRVVVHAQAQKTDAQLSNANLLLSNQAEVDTKPELEIYADDVKCSHGATIGQLDENMLFYLRSRAIDEKTAKSLLTFAFAEDVISRIGFKPVRERLELSVVGKLPDTELIRNFMS